MARQMSEFNEARPLVDNDLPDSKRDAYEDTATRYGGRGAGLPRAPKLVKWPAPT